MMENLITIEQLSEKLSVKVGTLRQWIFNKQMPVIRIGGLVRFKESDIESWIQLGQLGKRPEKGGDKK